MDPQANLHDQLEVARRLQAQAERVPDGQPWQPPPVDVIHLVECVLALDAWRRKGGFDPYGRAA